MMLTSCRQWRTASQRLLCSRSTSALSPLGYEPPRKRTLQRPLRQPASQDPDGLKQRLDAYRTDIDAYLDLPPAERLMTQKKDMRQISAELQTFTSGLVETPYLHRAMTSVLYPGSETLGFDRPPKRDFYDDYRELLAELLAVHAPEPHHLGHGWQPAPVEQPSLRHLKLGDVRSGCVHWCHLREHKAVVRVCGPWNSVDHGWRVAVIDFRRGELVLLKRDYHDVDKAELGIDDDPEMHEFEPHTAVVVDGLVDADPSVGALPPADFTIDAVRKQVLDSPLLRADDTDLIYAGPASRAQGVAFSPQGLSFQPDDSTLSLDEQAVSYADQLSQHIESVAQGDNNDNNNNNDDDDEQTTKRRIVVAPKQPAGAGERIPTELARLLEQQALLDAQPELAAQLRRLVPGQLTDEMIAKAPPVEQLLEDQELVTLVPYHPDLFAGAWWPPYKIHHKLGIWLTRAERDMLFVAPAPKRVRMSFKLPPGLDELLRELPGLDYSADHDSFGVQAKKLRYLLPNEDIRKLHVQVDVVDEDGRLTSKLYSQRELACADVDEQERRVLLSPRWLAAAKSAMWPKPMMAIPTNVYWPYERDEGAVHALKPSETSPLSELREERAHRNNNSPAEILLDQLRDVPDLETIDPDTAAALDQLINTPGVHFPLPGVGQGDLDPFDIDRINDDPDNPESFAWRLISDHVPRHR